jgi:hypothetical protein
VVSSKCKRCECDKEGDGWYCVYCFAKFCRPCRYCMEMDTQGRYRVRKVVRQRRQMPIDCEWCQNERYVLMEE